jgi:hypothetical protein
LSERPSKFQFSVRYQIQFQKSIANSHFDCSCLGLCHLQLRDPPLLWHLPTKSVKFGAGQFELRMEPGHFQDVSYIRVMLICFEFRFTYIIVAALIVTFLILDTSNDRKRLMGLCGMTFYIVLMFLTSAHPSRVSFLIVFF